ncbi:hypothetical protein ACT3R9_13610 [Psychrobacter sp. AOP42-A1-21]|uniref:hypothetical protein n=1 Tax=Psychrobacter sp. AOP42-A1-21 TaxID=3457675 RepID=UPI004035ED97
MDKRLLDQVQKALDAQQETIQRQKKMLDDQNQYIYLQLQEKDNQVAELTASLNKLLQARTQQAKDLPRLLEQLQSKISEQMNIQNGWVKHRKEFVGTLRLLATESITLSDALIRLTELMQTYQSTIAPQDNQNSVTSELETILGNLKNSQTTIKTTQGEISSSQTTIDKTQQSLIEELRQLERLSKR